MEYNRIRIDLFDYGLKKDSSWFLEPLSDIHFGHRNFNLEKFQKAVKRVTEQKNRSTFFNGDMIDNIPHRDKRFNWDTIDPEAAQDVQQVELFEKYTQELLDLNHELGGDQKVHGVLPGNHEFVYESVAQFKYFFCRKYPKGMGLKFLGDAAYIWIDFYYKNKFLHNFVILTTHGSYRGSQSGGELNQLKRFPARYYADVYFVGHSHDIKSGSSVIIEPHAGPGRSLKLRKREIIYANLGTFLETHQFGVTNYIEKKLLYAQATKTGTVTIEFNPESRTMNFHE